ICGLQTQAAVDALTLLPVDYAGFVFANSRRQVSVAQAAVWNRELQSAEREHSIQTVGVFVNPDEARLADVMEHVRLDVIQLHGQESAQACRDIKDRYRTSIFKVFSVSGTANSLDIIQQMNGYVGI